MRELQNICGTKMMLPASFTPSYRLTISHEPFASGGYGDLYHGTLDGSKVSVKRVRLHAIDDQSKSAKVCSRLLFIVTTQSHDLHRPSAERR